MKIILRVTDVLTVLGYRCRDTCQLIVKHGLRNPATLNIPLRNFR